MLPQKTLYIVGLALWISYVLLLPTWVGRMYNEDVLRPGVFTEGGVFGLSGGNPFESQSPLWNPPLPHSDAIAATVRWPGHPITQHTHIELALSRIATRLTLGMLVLGVLLRAAAWLTAFTKRVPFQFIFVSAKISGSR